MDEKVIERIGQKAAHVDLRDHILAWDRKQGGPRTKEQRCCPEHGNRLTMRGDGNALICGVTRPAQCDVMEPVSR